MADPVRLIKKRRDARERMEGALPASGRYAGIVEAEIEGKRRKTPPVLEIIIVTAACTVAAVVCIYMMYAVM